MQLNKAALHWGVVGLGLVSGACSSRDEMGVASEEKVPTGLQVQALVSDGTDVESISYSVQQVDCVTGASVGYPEVIYVPLSSDYVPGDIAELEDNPLAADSAHLSADAFVVAPAGCFDVTATPLGASGQASADCAIAKKSGVVVEQGQTVEVLLINQCAGDDPGALDAVAALNHEPVIDDVWFGEGKFICGSSGTICAAAHDPDGDPLEYALELPADALCSATPLPSEGDVLCWSLACSDFGKHTFAVVVYDQLSGDAGPVRIEDWLAAEGYASESHSELNAFAYFEGISVYADADGDGYGDPSSTSLACGDVVPPGFVNNSDDCDDASNAVNPEASELCNGIDDDCDGTTDEGLGCGGDGVEITAGGYAYGHHGDCQGWNQCGDAGTCALWACMNEGYDVLVSYGDSAPCGIDKPFTECHLMLNGSSGGVQYNWWVGWHGDPPNGSSCDVMAVGEIFCAHSGGEPEPEPEADGGAPAPLPLERASCRGETCLR
jgi:Putative metal-binding motif